MTSRARAGGVALWTALVAACDGDGRGDPAGDFSAPLTVASELASGASAPERFGFGTVATAERIALWDIDVKPDGEGLPRGSGSVAEGRAVYNLQCLACHGPTGTEGPNDPLVGPPPDDDWPLSRAAGHYWPYATTLFDYIRRAMPQLTPGTLTNDETYAVTAYILNLNGLIADDAVLTAATLATVEMPARDRFVPDDRRGGPEVR